MNLRGEPAVDLIGLSLGNVPATIRSVSQGQRTLIITQISGQISYSYSMKWYSYSIVHPIEYEYCPSGGVRVRKTQGNWNVMCKNVGKDEAQNPSLTLRVRIQSTVREPRSRQLVGGFLR